MAHLIVVDVNFWYNLPMGVCVMAKISDILNPNSATNKAMRLPTLQNEINIEPEEIKNMLEAQSEIDFAPVRAADSVEAILDKLETERQERKRGDKTNRIIAIGTLIIALLTLVATIAVPLLISRFAG